jgi:hypothetical protein
MASREMVCAAKPPENQPYPLGQVTGVRQYQPAANVRFAPITAKLGPGYAQNIALNTNRLTTFALH